MDRRGRRSADAACFFALVVAGVSFAVERVADADEEPKPAAAAPASAAVRGPAEDLIVEAAFGYGVGALTTIQGHDPKVPHGPMFHAGLGWAWTIRKNQSVGVELFADGTLDGDKTTKVGTQMAGRYGASAFLYGERAHLRVGAGYARTTMGEDEKDSKAYSGIGITFAAGWHFAIGPQTGWKRAAITLDILPSWDFLGAGSETLHRWNFGLVLGVAVL